MISGGATIMSNDALSSRPGHGQNPAPQPQPPPPQPQPQAWNQSAPPPAPNPGPPHPPCQTAAEARDLREPPCQPPACQPPPPRRPPAACQPPAPRQPPPCQAAPPPCQPPPRQPPTPCQPPAPRPPPPPSPGLASAGEATEIDSIAAAAISSLVIPRLIDRVLAASRPLPARQASRLLCWARSASTAESIERQNSVSIPKRPKNLTRGMAPKGPKWFLRRCAGGILNDDFNMACGRRQPHWARRIPLDRRHWRRRLYLASCRPGPCGQPQPHWAQRIP